jgi:hypothetical protein
MYTRDRTGGGRGAVSTPAGRGTSLQLARFSHRLVLLAASVLLCGSCAGGAMTPYRFQRDAASLGSLAAEGEVLARQAAAGDAPGPFVAAHASEVGADAGDLASVVASTHSEAGRGARSRELASLARSVDILLERLEHSPDDRVLATQIAHRLDTISDRAAKLEASA